jgi:hypothetical protein
MAVGPGGEEYALVRTEELQISRAFTFLIDDPRWWLKILIGALFVVASVLVVPYFFILGYQMAVIRAVAAGDDSVMPEWNDLGRKFKDGASLFLITFIYALPMLLVLALVVVLGILVGGGPTHSTVRGILLALAVIWFIIGWLFVTIYSLALRFASPAIYGTFANTASIRQTLQPGVVIGLVRADIKAYLLVFLMVLATGAIAFVGFFALCIGVFFTVFYASVVNAHLIGQLTRLNPYTGAGSAK